MIDKLMNEQTSAVALQALEQQRQEEQRAQTEDIAR